MTIPFSPIIDEAMEGGSESRPKDTAPSHRPTPDAPPAESPRGITAVIARLEAATEGLRELDAEIWWIVNRAAAARAYWNAAPGLPRELGDGMPKGVGRIAVQCYAPAYTTSLDAAITLVPKSCGWCVGDVHPPGESYLDTGRPWAEIWMRGYQHIRLPGMLWDGIGRNGINAETPALAMCIAALKASVDARESGMESRTAGPHRGHAAEAAHPVTTQTKTPEPAGTDDGGEPT